MERLAAPGEGDTNIALSRSATHVSFNGGLGEEEAEVAVAMLSNAPRRPDVVPRGGSRGQTQRPPSAATGA